MGENSFRLARFFQAPSGYTLFQLTFKPSKIIVCPGGKIIDCGPVGPLMMDLSPSCWEGPSPSHFKGPGALALSMDQVHHIAKGLKSFLLGRAKSIPLQRT